MIEFDVDVAEACLNVAIGRRKDVKIKRNCEVKSGFGFICKRSVYTHIVLQSDLTR